MIIITATQEEQENPKFAEIKDQLITEGFEVKVYTKEQYDFYLQIDNLVNIYRNSRDPSFPNVRYINSIYPKVDKNVNLEALIIGSGAVEKAANYAGIYDYWKNKDFNRRTFHNLTLSNLDREFEHDTPKGSFKFIRPDTSDTRIIGTQNNDLVSTGRPKKSKVERRRAKINRKQKRK